MALDFISDINVQINSGNKEGLNYPRTDKFMIVVHWWSFAGIVVLSYLTSVIKLFELYGPSPFSYRVPSLIEAGATIALAFVTALLPTLLIGKFKNHYHWRLLLTLTLSMFCYLAVFISGGSIEMHFLFFVMIALIVIYADWRLGWVMLILVALHHGILNFVAPRWVFNYGENILSVVAHAIPVVIAVIFTTVISNIHRSTVEKIEQRADQLFHDTQLIVESSHDAIIGGTLEGVIESWNSGASKMLGYAEKEFIGKPILFVTPPELSDEFSKLLEKVSHGEVITDYDSIWLRKDGTRINIGLSIAPVYSKANVSIGFSLVGRDITERKKSEQHMKELDFLKNKFIQVVSHQMRTPLGVMRWNLESLLGGEMGGKMIQEQEDALRVVYNHDLTIIERLDDLILTLDIENRVIILEKENADIRSLVNSIIIELDPMIKLKKTKVTFAVPDKIYPVNIDSKKIRQAMAKIIDNALRYSQEGHEVKISLEGKGQEVIVTVSDRGIGIPAAEQNRVFEKFYRASNASTMSPDASGLGLFIAKNIIELHGGEIWFNSREGIGTDFYFKLPIAAS